MEEQGARARAEQNVLFLVFFFVSFFGRPGRRRSESPARIGNAGVRRDMVMYEKPTAAMTQ